MALVFDIETVGADFESLDESTQHSLTRWIKRESAGDERKYNVYLTDVKEGLGFSPLTGEIVTIGVYDTNNEKGVVYYQNKKEIKEEKEKENFIFKPKTEKEMLNSFWAGASKYKEFVSFNGRQFDVPFLMIRSAVHKIRPSMNLMSSRYLSRAYGPTHIDLQDQLAFYGAVRRKGSLHLYCNAFGIKSPKASGITGDDVRELFKQGKYFEIAEYNSWDLIATTELYKIWKEFIRM